MTDSQAQGFSKDYMNAVIAVVTEALRDPPANDPVYLQTISRAINEVPKDTQLLVSTRLIYILVRHLARVQQRTPEVVWREIALIMAEGVPEDE